MDFAIPAELRQSTECLVGFLIKNDGIPAPLREAEITTKGDGVAHSVRPGATGGVRSVRLAFKIRFGRALWRILHGLADGWPCHRCRPEMTVWMQGLHDAVNARLGKRVFRPDAYGRYASGSLQGGFHRGCIGCRIARIGSRLLARAPRPGASRP